MLESQSLETFLCRQVHPGVSDYMFREHGEKDRARQSKTTKREGGGVCKSGMCPGTRYSTCTSIMQEHSSRPWLQHLTPNKPSSLWAACYSQCVFPNGHNRGQDHLLLLGGEVCIQLQLGRKTSWCL